MPTDELSLVDCVAAVRRHWRVVWLLPVAVSAVTAAITLFVLPRRYEATTTVLVPYSTGQDRSALLSLVGALPPNALPLAGLGGMAARSPIETYRAVLESRRIAEPIVARFHLVERYRCRNIEEALKDLKSATAVSVDSKASMIGVRVRVGGTPRLGRATHWGPGDRDARTLAADIGNAYISGLDRYIRENSLFQAQSHRRFVEKQVGESRRHLRTAEEDLRSYQEHGRITSVPDEAKELVGLRMDLLSRRTEAKVAQSGAEKMLRELRARLLAQADAGLVDSVPDAQDVVTAIRTRLAELEADFRAQSEAYTPSHPEIRQLQQRIDETRTQLKQELSRVHNAVGNGVVAQIIEQEVDRAAAEVSLAEIDRALADVTKRVSQFPQQAVGVARLQREVEVASTLYKLMATEHEQARIEEVREVPRLQVVDEAVAPLRHRTPSVLRNTALSFLLAFMLAVYVACARGAAGGRRMEPGRLPGG